MNYKLCFFKPALFFTGIIVVLLLSLPFIMSLDDDTIIGVFWMLIFMLSAVGLIISLVIGTIKLIINKISKKDDNVEVNPYEPAIENKKTVSFLEGRNHLTQGTQPNKREVPPPPKNKTGNNTGKILLMIVLPVVFVIVLIVYNILTFYTTTNEGFIYFSIIIGLLLIVLICIGIMQWSHTCPNCKAWNSMKEANCELVEKTNIKIEKTVYDKHRRGNKQFGPADYTTERTAHVPGERMVYNVTFECVKCGTIEEKTKVVEREK